MPEVRADRRQLHILAILPRFRHVPTRAVAAPVQFSKARFEAAKYDQPFPIAASRARVRDPRMRSVATTS